jgi:GNAT superfamily N-acetyltransferase
MYTLPAHRRQGLAKAILAQAMHFAQAAGCQKIWLHASPAGRALYESHGFRADGAYLAWTPQRC